MEHYTRVTENEHGNTEQVGQQEHSHIIITEQCKFYQAVRNACRLLKQHQQVFLTAEGPSASKAIAVADKIKEQYNVTETIDVCSTEYRDVWIPKSPELGLENLEVIRAIPTTNIQLIQLVDGESGSHRKKQSVEAATHKKSKQTRFNENRQQQKGQHTRTVNHKNKTVRTSSKPKLPVDGCDQPVQHKDNPIKTRTHSKQDCRIDRIHQTDEQTVNHKKSSLKQSNDNSPDNSNQNGRGEARRKNARNDANDNGEEIPHHKYRTNHLPRRLQRQEHNADQQRKNEP